MKKEHVRYGLLFVLIVCLFAFPISCGSGGGSGNIDDPDAEEAAAVDDAEEEAEEEEEEPLPGEETGGEPSYIVISADPEVIQVKGTGGTESATISAAVKDSTGAPINDCPPGTDNVQFEILSNPGGVLLDSGDGPPATTVQAATNEGIARVSLLSGTIPGTVIVEATVLQNGTCSGVPASPVTGQSTLVGIEAGPPYSITLYTAPKVIPNDDGSTSWVVSAMVVDQNSNPVNDTAVRFGLVDNFKTGGTDGVSNGTDLFASAAVDFAGDGVGNGDTLVIMESPSVYEGGHIIAVAGDDLTLESPLLGPGLVDLDFVAGDPLYAQVCGVGTTGDLVPNAECIPSTGERIKGVAHSLITYSPSSCAIFKTFLLYAGTATPGGTLGTTLFRSYPAVEPVTIEVTFVPDSGTDGETVNVYAHIFDAVKDLECVDITFRTSNTTNTGWGGVGNGVTVSATDFSGFALEVLDTVGAVGSSYTTTVTVSSGIHSDSAVLTINP